MAVSAHLPPLPKISQEIITQLIAVLCAAWIISKVPQFKAILSGAGVTGNSLSKLDNP